MTQPLEDTWLSAIKRLYAIASSGLHFGETEFDRERYEEICHITNQMLADLGKVPIKTIENLVSVPGQRYETPLVDVRGAVFKGDQILLVKERLDGLWTLPGGYADVGISPKENVVKEISEEANLNVRAKKLFAIVHKARHEYDADARDFYKLFFLCERLDDTEPTTGIETAGVGYFDLDDLPPLSTGRVIAKHIHLAKAHLDNPNQLTYFD